MTMHAINVNKMQLHITELFTKTIQLCAVHVPCRERTKLLYYIKAQA
jgi:hypothetical protein